MFLHTGIDIKKQKYFKGEYRSSEIGIKTFIELTITVTAKNDHFYVDRL